MKSAVITGGNRGIGWSITEAFVRAGYFVVVGARSSRDVEQLAPDQVAFVEMDVRNEADHSKLAQVAIAKTEGLMPGSTMPAFRHGSLSVKLMRRFSMS